VINKGGKTEKYRYSRRRKGTDNGVKETEKRERKIREYLLNYFG
jgi:hypothetical protein